MAVAWGNEEVAQSSFVEIEDPQPLCLYSEDEGGGGPGIERPLGGVSVASSDPLVRAV